MKRSPREHRARDRRCSLRTLVITRPGSALLITQDIRRRHFMVTGSTRVHFEPDENVQTMASQLGCAFVARVKQ